MEAKALPSFYFPLSEVFAVLFSVILNSFPLASQEPFQNNREAEP